MRGTAAALILLVPYSGFAWQLQSQPEPLNEAEVLSLLAADLSIGHIERLAHQVAARGIGFGLSDEFVQSLRAAGGDDALIEALHSAKLSRADKADPATGAKYAQVLQHVARGAEFKHKKRFAEAIQEFQAAVLAAPRERSSPSRLRSRPFRTGQILGGHRRDASGRPAKPLRP